MAANNFGTYDPAPLYDEQLVTSFYVPARDGTRIAISLHRPAKNGMAVEGRFPVIWQATLEIARPGLRKGPPDPGSRDIGNLTYNGYVAVTMARRGAGSSFGTRRGYEDLTEAYDSYDVNEWIARQPWSNGMIGMYGCSNTGEAVLHAITIRPPHLKAAFAGCFSWNRYDGFTRGGILANWGTGPTRTLEQDMAAAPVQGDENLALLRLAAQEHQGSTSLLELEKTMPYRDTFSPLVMSKFWYEASPSTYADQIRQANVALYVQGGWYDDFRREGLVAFSNLEKDRYIVVGPWTHCANPGFAMRSELLRFFDAYLRNIDTGIKRDAPIHYFTVNAADDQAWRATTTWPVPDVAATRLFLTGGKGGLTTSLPGEQQTSFQVDYARGCEGVDSSSPNQTTLQPCHPVRGAASFAMDVLNSDMEVTGHPVITLWITSSTPDANLFAYLEDVSPDGKVTAITEGRIRASLSALHEAPWNNLGLPWHRSFMEDARGLSADNPVEITFDMLPTSYVFKAGHRVQISVAGSDYRERERREQTPAPVVTLHLGGRHAAAIVLPVVTVRRGQ